MLYIIFFAILKEKQPNELLSLILNTNLLSEPKPSFYTL